MGFVDRIRRAVDRNVRRRREERFSGMPVLRPRSRTQSGAYRRDRRHDHATDSGGGTRERRAWFKNIWPGLGDGSKEFARRGILRRAWFPPVRNRGVRGYVPGGRQWLNLSSPSMTPPAYGRW